MTPESQQWLDQLTQLQSDAYRQLLTFAFSWSPDSGYRTAESIITYILSEEERITNTIGDCPN